LTVAFDAMARIGDEQIGARDGFKQRMPSAVIADAAKCEALRALGGRTGLRIQAQELHVGLAHAGTVNPSRTWTMSGELINRHSAHITVPPDRQKNVWHPQPQVKALISACVQRFGIGTTSPMGVSMRKRDTQIAVR
jgi:hypothetical protein